MQGKVKEKEKQLEKNEIMTKLEIKEMIKKKFAKSQKDISH